MDRGPAGQFQQLLQLLLLLCGGIIVTRIGVGLIQEEPTLDQSVEVDLPLKDVAVKACVVTWFNPQAILDGTMIFGGFRAGTRRYGHRS